MSRPYWQNQQQHQQQQGGQRPERAVNPTSQWIFTEHSFMRDTKTGKIQELPTGHMGCLKGCGCDPLKDIVTGPCDPSVGANPWIPNPNYVAPSPIEVLAAQVAATSSSTLTQSS